MYATVTNYVRNLTDGQYGTLMEMFHWSKSLYNVGLYNARQEFFASGGLLSYEDNYAISYLNENYKMLAAKGSQQVLQSVTEAMSSFLELKRKAAAGMYDPKAVRLPRYLPKEGLYHLAFPAQGISIKGGMLKIPISMWLQGQVKKGARKAKDTDIWIPYPPNLVGKKLKEVQFYPVGDGKAIKVAYVYKEVPEPKATNKDNILGIDLGVDNFATCVSTVGTSFILDGRDMKSINQWYNKELARLRSLQSKAGIKGSTKRQFSITQNRNNRIYDIIYKSAKYVINHCIEHGIGTVVIGRNKYQKKETSLGKQNNQNFVSLPYGKFYQQLEYLCDKHGINYVEQEESYTSKSSFLDLDPLPVYGDTTTEIAFSGKRTKRGLYITKNGIEVNADINGAANIIRKSSQGFESGDRFNELSRGVMRPPRRVKVVSRNYS